MDENTAIKAAKIFLKAAAYIRTYGWQEKGMSISGKPRCSMGALASAYPKSEWDEHLASLMYKELYKELDGITLTEFNHKVQCGDNVALLYERVASSLVSQF